jgi:hypothetical protein
MCSVGAKSVWRNDHESFSQRAQACYRASKVLVAVPRNDDQSSHLPATQREEHSSSTCDDLDCRMPKVEFLLEILQLSSLQG